jgi:hypothetical protein
MYLINITNVTTTEITCKKKIEFGQRGIISFFMLVTNKSLLVVCKGIITKTYINILLFGLVNLE